MIGGLATIVAALSLVLGPVPTAASAARPMIIRSPAFADGAAIPDGFTCDGANASPPLRFQRIPRGAKDVALIVTDPDAPIGTFVHWVAWRLPRRGVPEQSLPASVQQGTNGRGVQGWSGPCPPPGDAHHYVFALTALSKRLDLAPGATADELRRAMKGTVLARARLVGTYQR